MQFLEKPWFFVALVAMHAGIALFVVSKRVLRRQDSTSWAISKASTPMLLRRFC